MKILFLAQHNFPHIGGVEKHVNEVTKRLRKMGNIVKVVSEEYIKYPHIKFLGLLYIWAWLFNNRNKIKNVDIIHCHDVFIWYLPFRLLYPNKKVFTTFHGWEGVYPISWKNIFFKKLASKLSTGTISIGRYIEKYYKIKSDIVLYGGREKLKKLRTRKQKNTIVFLGRLEKDTGVLQFLKWLKTNGSRMKVEFLGDGSLREECEVHGEVHGFTDPNPFLQKAEYCVPGGYLSYIEAKEYGCKIRVFSDNRLKRDYWNEIEKIKKFPTWDGVANLYLDIWKK